MSHKASNTLPGMVRTVENGSKVALQMPQTTWLDSVPSTQRVSGNRKRAVQPQETFEEEQKRHQAEQRAIWAREGIFWCKLTETWESRRDGQSSKPVSGHWFHNKGKGVLEMYDDVRHPPVQTKEVYPFNKLAK
jgi:hypothetical protein